MTVKSAVMYILPPFLRQYESSPLGPLWLNFSNPVVKILLSKMNYEPEEQSEVLWHAYKGFLN